MVSSSIPSTQRSVAPARSDTNLRRPFPYFGSSFYSPRSPVLCFFSVYFFVNFLITSLHLSFGLPIFWCPLTSIISLLHLPLSFYLSVSTHFHHLVATSSSVFLSTSPNHLSYVCHTCPCYYFFRPDLLNPLYSHHPSQHSPDVPICFNTKERIIAIGLVKEQSGLYVRK